MSVGLKIGTIGWRQKNPKSVGLKNEIKKQV